MKQILFLLNFRAIVEGFATDGGLLGWFVVVKKVL